MSCAYIESAHDVFELAELMHTNLRVLFIGSANAGTSCTSSRISSLKFFCIITRLTVTVDSSIIIDTNSLISQQTAT